MRWGLFLVVVVWGCGEPHETPRDTEQTQAPATTVHGWGRVPSIVVGGERSCVTLRDDGVACWGNGWDHRLGTGELGDSAEPVRVGGMGRVMKLSQDCALSDDGRVWCWGSSVPIVGDAYPEREALDVPTDVGLPVAVDIQGTCALTESGEVHCTSEDWEVVSLGPGVREFVFSKHMLCGRNQQGRVVCFDRELGRGSYEPVEHPPLMATQLGLVRNSPVALAADGQAFWLNTRDGVWVDREVPQLSSRIGHGDNYRSCVIQRGGQVFCSQNDEWIAVEGAADAVAVATSLQHSCAVQRSGKIICWGRNHRGQLGGGSTTESMVPVQVMGIDLSEEEELSFGSFTPGQCLEPDTDGDGLGDRFEMYAYSGCLAGPTVLEDGDGLDFEADLDSDEDGIPDALEHSGTPCLKVNIDCDDDGVPNFIDHDSDNDGLWDIAEFDSESVCSSDTDGDACGDLANFLWDGCAPNTGVFRFSDTEGLSETQVSLVAPSSLPPGTPLRLVIGEWETVFDMGVSILTPVAFEPANSNGLAVPDAEYFREVSPGETLSFAAVLTYRPSYIGGGTHVVRIPVTLEDVTGTIYDRGEVAMVFEPSSYCPDE